MDVNGWSQQPSVHGPDALAAAAVVAAMAENISSASATMPSVRSPLGVAAGRGGAQQPMYTTANANHGGHPPVMMGGMSGPNAMSAAMNQMVQAAAMVQAGASGASAAVAYSGSRASGGAGGKKRHPGPIMQPTSMPPQLQMQMQAVIQQQAQQAQQQHHQHQQQRYMSSPSMSPLHGAAAGMAAPGGPVGDTTKKVNRLWKNRLAAKECRRKKKEYVKDLEDKVRDLEQKNEELMKQLRTVSVFFWVLMARWCVYDTSTPHFLLNSICDCIVSTWCESISTRVCCNRMSLRRASSAAGPIIADSSGARGAEEWCGICV